MNNTQAVAKLVSQAVALGLTSQEAVTIINATFAGDMVQDRSFRKFGNFVGFLAAAGNTREDMLAAF